MNFMVKINSKILICIDKIVNRQNIRVKIVADTNGTYWKISIYDMDLITKPRANNFQYEYAPMYYLLVILFMTKTHFFKHFFFYINTEKGPSLTGSGSWGPNNGDLKYS